MFKVIVVEDEPVAAEHICALVERFCPGFRVAARAGNGVEALPLLRENRADLVITDIRMPVMGGLELTKIINEDFPDTCALIVSGYQEFQYAREAMKNNVFDYLLKPISPANLRQAMDQVEKKLRKLHTARRAELLRGFAGGQPAEGGQLEHYFPESAYYAALVRKNGLPRRFASGAPIEIFSDNGELLSIYGRDEMESLCLCPAGPIELREFEAIMERVLGDNTVPGYRTLILYPRAFPPGRAPEVIQELYGTLHLSTVVGVNRTVRTSGPPGPAGEIAADATLALMELQLQKGSIDGLHAAFCQCIDAWCEARHPQLTMEWAVKRVFQQLSGGGRLVFEDQVDLLVEDAFFSATTTGELRENLWDILSKALPRDTSAGLKIDSPAFFRKLQEYVESHLAEPRVAQSLCASFGLSQSYLSKLFRKHTDRSFNEYLTAHRMDRAKRLLQENQDMLVREVAALVGYSDQFYFSRLFRAVTGVSPSEFTG